MHPSRRAQASGFIVFFLIIGVGAILYALLDPAIGRVFTVGLNTTTNAEAEEAINQSEKIWENILFFVLGFAFVFLVARAVFQSKGGR